MDERAFETLADSTLANLLARIEDQAGDALDADLLGGILTIELDDGGQYVINKHAPNRQIWLSSPVSGASHYAWDETVRDWRSTRGGGSLPRLLGEELSVVTGRDVRFD